TGLAATHREEAELYANEALIDHLRVRFCDAAIKYASAAALILESEDGDAWPFLIGQARELCDDGREFGNRESLLLAADVCHRALGLVSREQRPSDCGELCPQLGQLIGPREQAAWNIFVRKFQPQRDCREPSARVPPGHPSLARW